MDRMASIEMAMKNEKTEMEYYLNEAKRSKNAVARAMFENLAKDEQEHMERISKLHQKLLSDGQWPEDVSIEVAGTNIKKTLETIVGQVGSAAEHDDDDIAALKKSIGFEAKGSKFYADLAEACGNPMERRFFQFLSRIEREHQLSLTDSLAYLEDPEGWNMQSERSGLDGA